VQIVGVDPRTYRRGRSRPERLADPAADLRILLCHFPNVIDKVPPGVFELVLAGHLHGGQICIPYGFGKLRLAHLRWTYAEGLYQRPGGVLHVSPGLGTTFVPFRFFARPEATELLLGGFDGTDSSPGRDGRSEARTQGGPIVPTIGPTEDAASGRAARPGGTDPFRQTLLESGS